MDETKNITNGEKLKEVYFGKSPSNDEWVAVFGVLGERCSLLLRELETLQDAIRGKDGEQ